MSVRFLSVVMNCTGGQLYTLHPDECRFQSAWSRRKNGLCRVFLNTAGSSHSGHGYWPVHMRCAHCRFSYTVPNPVGCVAGSGGHCCFLYKQSGHNFPANILFRMSRQPRVYIWADSGIYAHPLRGHFPMGTFYGLPYTEDYLLCTSRRPRD